MQKVGLQHCTKFVPYITNLQGKNLFGQSEQLFEQVVRTVGIHDHKKQFGQQLFFRSRLDTALAVRHLNLKVIVEQLVHERNSFKFLLGSKQAERLVDSELICKR